MSLSFQVLKNQFVQLQPLTIFCLIRKIDEATLATADPCDGKYGSPFESSVGVLHEGLHEEITLYCEDRASHEGEATFQAWKAIANEAGLAITHLPTAKTSASDHTNLAIWVREIVIRLQLKSELVNYWETKPEDHWILYTIPNASLSSNLLCDELIDPIEEEREGPLSPTEWIHQGRRVQCNLRPQAYKLAKLLFSKKARLANFDEIEKEVFIEKDPETNLRFNPQKLRDAAKAMNKSIEQFGWKVSVDARNQICHVQKKF